MGVRIEIKNITCIPTNYSENTGYVFLVFILMSPCKFMVPGQFGRGGPGRRQPSWDCSFQYLSDIKQGVASILLKLLF
jgi:hypothetical protein